jgi:hypothetical protein
MFFKKTTSNKKEQREYSRRPCCEPSMFTFNSLMLKIPEFEVQQLNLSFFLRKKICAYLYV